MSNQLQGMAEISSELYGRINSVAGRLNKVESDITEYKRREHEQSITGNLEDFI